MNGSCVYCLFPFDRDPPNEIDGQQRGRRTREHIVPLAAIRNAKRHGYRLILPDPNIVYACRWCNESKGRLLIPRWLADGKLRREAHWGGASGVRARSVLAREKILIAKWGTFPVHLILDDSLSLGEVIRRLDDMN